MDIVKDRGAATKGRAARATAGADAVEVKATIPAEQARSALKRYQLDPAELTPRYIYFFDTAKLTLFRNGIIGRARRIVGGQHDSTIKFRPVVPTELPDRWRKAQGLKVEADASDRGVVTSASLTLPVPKGLIKKVAAGEQPIGRLFQEDQIDFLLAIAKRRFDPAKVTVLGPVEAWRWKIVDPRLPWPVTIDLWRRPDRGQILEVSIKAPVAQAAVAYFGFMAFLAEVGVERDQAQEAKTRWALSFFVERSASRR